MRRPFGELSARQTAAGPPQRLPIFVSTAQRRTPATVRGALVVLAAVLGVAAASAILLGRPATAATLLVTATILLLGALSARRR